MPTEETLRRINICDALKLLKKVCKDFDSDCPSCPLGSDDGSCMLGASVPEDWKINEEPNIWRAFK